MKMPPTTPENKYSRLLTSDENLQIFKLLGNRCQTISTTVVQLFLTDPPNHSHWIKRDVGVLCFIKDNMKKNYFFRLFCLRRNSVVWEHELYTNLDYIESTIFFHIFEGDDTMVGFNFASEDEAQDLKRVVDDKILVRRRREEKRTRHSKEYQPSQKYATNYINPDNNINYKKSIDSSVKKAKRRRNITKADIGSPSDFKHISHVGWNPDSGFDIDSQDEYLKVFFEKAGISEKQLQDKDTKEFIYDFISKHGGREAIEESTNRNSSRRAPAIPQNHGNNQAPPVPPVPPRGTMRQHVRTAPPPPPPPSATAKPPQVSNVNHANVNNNYYVESKGVSVVPPPPPMADFEAAAPIPPPPPPVVGNFNNAPPAPSMNMALLDSIRSGTTLKSVEERKVVPVVEDGRNQLLQQIREGTKLKPACERETKPINNVAEPRTGDLAEALARALAERSKAIHSEDDDDDDDEDSNDDEWED